MTKWLGKANIIINLTSLVSSYGFCTFQKGEGKKKTLWVGKRISISLYLYNILIRNLNYK